MVDVGEGPLGYPVLKVGAPAPDRRVEPTQKVCECAMGVPAGQDFDRYLDRSQRSLRRVGIDRSLGSAASLPGPTLDAPAQEVEQVAAELPAIGKLGLPTIENKLSTRDIRSAWRLLPDLQVGIVHLRGPDSLGALVEVLRQAAAARVGSVPRLMSWPKRAKRYDSPGWRSRENRRPTHSLPSSTTPRQRSPRSAPRRRWRRSGRRC